MDNPTRARDELNRFPRLTAMGHAWWAGWLLAGAANLIGPYVLDNAPAAVARLTLAGMLMLLGFGIACAASHLRSVCPACHAAFPLDPGAQAERDGWWLRLYHRRAARTAAQCMSIALLAFSSHTPWHVVTVAAFVAVGLTCSRSESCHRRLLPWCPLCRDDHGGGDAVTTDTPTPVGTATR